MNRTADAVPMIDLTVVPPRARPVPAADALAVPWEARRLPVPDGVPVSFGSMPPFGPARAGSMQRLVRPWDGVTIDAPASPTVSFFGLAAPCRPVLPSQRPGSTALDAR